MASLKSQGTSSPSASSIFLPLGRRSRRGSHASVSSQTERENLNEALDQIHTAACQSDSLTVFNEFTSPPAPSSVSENKGLTGDLPGGLSGLYNRFRASVGGVKDIVGGSAKQSEVSSPDNNAIKSPNTDTFHSKASSVSANTGSADGPTPPTNSSQGSKLHSPVAGTFGGFAEGSTHAFTSKSSKISSKAASVSSKASAGTPGAIKSPVGPLTKTTKYTTADPTVTELHVNAVKDSPHHTRSNSGSISSHAFPSSDSLSLERNDNSTPLSKSQSSLDPASRQSHSPVLTTRPSNDPYRDGRSAPSGRIKPTNGISDLEKASGQGRTRADHNGVSEPDASFTGATATRKNRQADGAQDTIHSSREHQTPNPRSNPPDITNCQTSATTSLSKFSNDQSSTHEGRTPTTLATSLSLTDNPPSSHSSRTSMKNPREKLPSRMSQTRLPGFAMTRATPTPSESTTTRPTAGPQRRDSHEVNRVGNNSPDQRWKYPIPGSNDVNLRNSAMSQLRSKLLSRDFWMRDENAKDCFHCGEPFTTFRRKHHCRTCGQIFDAKCTLLVSGADFGNSGSIRVCRPCEAMINAHEDDSSEYSGEDLSPVVINHPSFDSGTKSQGQADDDDTSSIVSQPVDHVMKTPTMAIPVTRRAGEGNSRRSAILEFDSSDRASLRPTSSRSVKSSMNIRPHSMGHKRHHSRHQYIRSFKSYHEERAPFQRGAGEDTSRENPLSAFHRDSIIDPDLAQYLSDDASSGDEQPNLFSAVSDGALSKSGNDSERTQLGGLLSAVKKGRSRIGERSRTSGLNSGRDIDDGSISSSRAVNLPRQSRRRNLSVASSVHQRMSPRASKDNAALIPNLQDHPVPSLNLGPQGFNSSGFKMTRSSSMRGAGAPAVELNRASLQHVRNLLRQLLDDASVTRVTKWETALIPILLKVTDDVDPDVQRGDDMDIRHYVKLKRIPGGHPGDTSYVSGLVFTKNLALKSMPRSISRPNILIITFALEYARHEQHFMSLEPVIRQEREFLENLVSRIAALRPHLLLVEKHVSGLALQYLEKANIATAYNVKPAVIEAVSRCCQTRIITSMDKLATTPEHTGQCGSFDLKTYVHSGRKKTYMYLSGCPKELGCTIVLRGSEDDVLVKIKRIMEFMVYVVYNLKLETCLMRDEFAQIPSSTTDEGTAKLNPPTFVDQPKANGEGVDQPNAENPPVQGPQTADEAAKSVAKSQEPSPPGESHISSTAEGSDLPDDVPMPTFYEDMVEKQQTKILSASPFVKFMQPYLLMRARELERRLAYLKRLRDQDFSIDQAADEKSQTKKFVLITPEMIHESLAGASSKVKEVLHAVHDAEYDRALHNYETQKRQWETYVSGNLNLFDPYAHQNIVVLYSLVCTTTSIPCSGPDVFALGFYNEHENDRAFEADCTLGQYVEDLCQSANAVCTVNGCEKRMMEHHRQYVHGEAQVSVFVQPYPSKMRGLQDTILMWSSCKICGNETQVMPMSDSTWKYSFGKYLELSFWSRNLHARAGICPHDLHQDHLRYFGFKDVALRFHYDPINLLEIIVPRPRVTWKVENDLRLKNDVYLKTEQRVNRFMGSVKARLKSINVQSVMPELAEACKQEIESLTKRAHEEHAALTKQLQESYVDSRYWEVIPLNQAVRATQEKVVEWDSAFAEFEKNFFPSEKDIKRMATLQLKRIFLDKDVSVTSLTSSDEATIAPAEEEADETSPTTTELPKRTRRMTLSPEKTQDVLVSVVEEHSGKMNKDKIKTIEEVPSPTSQAEERQSPYSSPPLRAASQEEVRHLDLAVPSSLSEKLSGTPPATELKPDSNPPGSPVKVPDDISPPPEVPGAVDIPAEPRTSVEVKSPTKDINFEEPTTPTRQRSNIPRLSDGGGFRRVTTKAKSPPLFRAQSQPAHLYRKNSGGSGPLSAFKSGFGASNGKQPDPAPTPPNETKQKVPEKRLSDRFGLGALKTGKLSSGHSLIPRSVPGKQSRRVSNLAKHFEQLSREFEKERFKERQQRVAKGRQSRAYPMASSKPIVEVYKNVQDAVEEKEPSIGEEFPPPRSPVPPETSNIAEELAEVGKAKPQVGDGPAEERVHADTQEPQPKTQTTSRSPSEIDADEYRSDEDRSLMVDIHQVESPEDTATESPEESFKLSPEEEFPKHEQNSLVKLLANFWAERSASGWKPLDYPLNVSEHVFADCDIIVREDEPSSIIAFALDSDVYKANLASIQEKDQAYKEKKSSPDADLNGDNQAEVEHLLLRATGTHLRYQFQEGQAKMLCKVFYAGQFDALRRKCGVSERIVESFSRCMKWDSKGGKTKSLFLKTLDERFILKSLSTIETQAFLKFAPAYFQIMSEALFHELPSAIAKMFGFYQVIIKNPATGVEFNWFLLVMENLFYDRVPNRIFDLKGSMRNRKVQITGERNEVLLDENMVEFIYESPLFTREHSKKLLSQSVWNDTLFLGRQNVMDYSLMIAIDESRNELVVGIIDCIRTYTWDKKLESWIKDRGFTGGGKNKPTVTSPKEYKSRFREAMARYVLHAPNCWHAIQASRIDRRPLRMEYHNDHIHRDGFIENIDESNIS
ncbi:1-phosphatidylinositol-3-phosphate 5-kinase [Arachnomyces sp. PD_36]|nr:1-phosphatidylinositol-3-phosphate 5-kinase [Arachnomyces sp. PD_36]